MDYLEFNRILSNVPKKWQDNPDQYFGFWDPIIKALEDFLGPQYKVTAHDPDIQVTCYYEIKDLDIKKQHSFVVPLEVAYKIYTNKR